MYIAPNEIMIHEDQEKKSSMAIDHYIQDEEGGANIMHPQIADPAYQTRINLNESGNNVADPREESV